LSPDKISGCLPAHLFWFAAALSSSFFVRVCYRALLIFSSQQMPSIGSRALPFLL
jgi:hypothetical protein